MTLVDLIYIFSKCFKDFFNIPYMFFIEVDDVVGLFKDFEKFRKP